MTVLLIDANYIAWRAFHSTGKNLNRGTTYGFLSTLQKLRDQFQPDRIAFCFDGDGPSKRKEIYPDYKGNRIKAGPELDNVRSMVCQEIKELRDKHLPALGWRNVFHADGFEADDLVASLVYAPQDGGKVIPQLWREVCGPKFIIVSADKDLYQLLDDDRVRMWEPSRNRMLDAELFRNEWGIDPARWVNVKAIAGCSSDNIPGVGGVGEKTAAKCLGWYKEKGLVPARIKTARDKIADNGELIKFNLRLVGLPYEGTPQFKLRSDEATGGKWLKWCEANQMSSLLRKGRNGSLEKRSGV